MRRSRWGGRGRLDVALALGWAAAIACGGRLAALDGGADARDAAALGDGVSPDASDGDGGDASADKPPACTYDASYDDVVPCVAPADDLIFADPPTVQVAAGGRGVVTFYASGPWASDPLFYMRYGGTTLPVLEQPYVPGYGTPITLSFPVSPAVPPGSAWTMTVSGHAGNIQRFASATLVVTACVPRTENCKGYECGFQEDGCGGVQICGTCDDAGATPNCYMNNCVGGQPLPQCPPGEGYDTSHGYLACVLCTQLTVCGNGPFGCHGGYCDSLQNVCFCHYPGG